MAEKRDNDRVKSSFSAIVSVEGIFHSHCIIRDVSETGMRLEFTDMPSLEERFEIRTPALPETVHVRKAWHQHKTMGVEFVAEDHNPEEISGVA